MAFKCLCYFVMFKMGPQRHISECMTVHSNSQMCKDHFTAGYECEITHTHTDVQRSPGAAGLFPGSCVQLGSFIYSERGGH